jgi:hypothetical protein
MPRGIQALDRDRLPGWPVPLRIREVLCLTTVRTDDTHPFVYSAAAEDLVQKTIMLPLGDQEVVRVRIWPSV